MKSKADLP